MQADPTNDGFAVGLFDQTETVLPAGGPRNVFVNPAEWPIAETEALAETGQSSTIGFLRKSDEVPEIRALNGATDLISKMAYGQHGSVMWARRPAGYHSRAHVHDCEQLNVVTRGSITGFVVLPSGKEIAVEVAAGDFWRVPRMSMHWSWNRADEPCEMVELHAPGRQWDPSVAGKAVPLLADTEAPPSVVGSPRTLRVDPARYRVERIEAQLAVIGS